MSSRKTVVFLSALLLFAASAFPIDVSIKGTVKDKSNNPLKDAVASLVKSGLSSVSDASGNFTIAGTLPDIGTKFNRRSASLGEAKPLFNGSQLSFSITGGPRQVRIDVYDIKGARVSTVVDQRLPDGAYRFSPLSLNTGKTASMVYLIRVQIGSSTATFVAPQVSAARRGISVLSGSREVAMLQKFPTAAVDTIEVTLCGYVLSRTAVDSWTQSGIAVALAQTALSAAGQKTIDSLFDRLEHLLDTLDTLESADQVKSLDFASLRDGFNKILKEEDSYNMKATLGYMVSSMLALNTNPSVWKMVDSLDAYFSALDSGSVLAKTGAYTGKSALMKKTFARGGIGALGAGLAAASLQSLPLTLADPAFPRFLTISFIQDIAENEVLPVLNNVVGACGRLESCGDRALSLSIEGDTFDLDKGEVYSLDMSVRLLRAGLNAFCMYDMNPYAKGTTDYRWIDSARTLESGKLTVYSLAGDTLVCLNRRDETGPMTFLANLVKYNMERPGFMCQRRPNNLAIKTDLLAIPRIFKTGLTYIRSEADNQSNDVIKMSDVMNADQDLADVPQRMIDDGVSPALANKFRSPEAIADFVTELLSGPYTFNEMTGDSFKINITMNLTAMLDAPVYDLRTLLPKYEWLPENEWTIRSEEWSDLWQNQTNQFFCQPGDSVAIPASQIDSVVEDSDQNKRYILKSDFHYQKNVDSSISCLPICLTTDAGARIKWEDIDSLVEAETFFPYFNDYTAGGLFPQMTRQKWLDLLYQK